MVRRAGICLAAMFLLAGFVRLAHAEQNMVRIAQPYGLVYLPSYVVVAKRLIEQHAKAAGLGEVQVTLTRMASGPAASDMLLSGNADLAMGGFGPAFTIWDKTHGAQQVRAVMPLSSSPVYLLSVDPRIHTLDDFGNGDKIAVSAIKVTDQAITLQMAAAKKWGWEQRFRLDPLTVSMSNPDALVAMLSGQSEVKNHATIIPFSQEELQSGKAHLVMTSDDYLVPGSSSTMMWTSARFHDANPLLYKAITAAFEEAIALINQNPREAAEIYVAREPQKHDLAWVEAMIKDPKLITYSSVPHGTLEHERFMFKVGTLKHEAQTWQELFWENEADKPGS
jgi:NitT/TauT family transport system substrate-binding protein